MHRRTNDSRTFGPGTRFRRGFTLTEMLVVVAVTAVLMVMLFAPLSRSLDMTARGQATVKAQDSVRKMMRRISAELSEAVQVYDPVPINLWGYNSWTMSRNRPRPAAGATPEAYPINGALIAFRLPKHRYYCTSYGHTITQDDIDSAYGPGTPYDWVAVGDCPRPGHAGSTVQLRPISPVQPDDRIVVYFVGLKFPGLRDGSSLPVYDNLLLFRQNMLTTYPTDYPRSAVNTYTVYRVEFTPGNPNLNWNNGNPSPNFFYDTTVAPNGEPYWKNWSTASIDPDVRSRVLLNDETADVVKWVERGGKFFPEPLVRFGPSAVVEETAQPNRSLGQYALSGSALPPDVAPAEYEVDFGNWTGVTGDGGSPMPDALLISNTPITGQLSGARIQVVDASGATAFDSAGSPRHRLVGFDSVSGRVVFAVRRWDAAAANRLDQQYFPGRIVPESGGTAQYTVELTGADGDNAVDQNGMPTGLNAGLTWANASAGNRVVAVVPGSEDVQVAVGGQMKQLRRGGWTGLPDPSYDRLVAPNDLDPDEYSIDYSTGRITLSEQDEAAVLWPTLPAGAVRVAYAIQTNRPNDVVRVSYSTREAAQLNIGLVEYTRRRGESLPFEVGQRVVIKNLKK